MSGESLALNARLRNLGVWLFGFWWSVEVTEVLGKWER